MHVNVQEGDRVDEIRLQLLLAGLREDVMRVARPVHELARADEIQEDYRLQGVRINDKHIVF